ncbi:hypothetical protein GCM10010909_20150 [Acidocella aquatica]|uniref:HEPN domain-containing protein n=1 Tax=Acidocella aquatica TaxID=1922313 RepID=A0ABQ6AB27_9PROT|nr:nucleotidyltransferase substrate binding protein [Acidocella aquatica]GLR67334.1 hypothetical protein GCM10010909_20150 [Acidocella aquatica]
MIDISSLEKALATLDETLAARARAPEDKFIRDACIQRFGYCYELAHNTLRRYLEASEPAGVRELSFHNIIRLGYERGFLTQSWDVWMRFRDTLKKKCEAYDDEIADEIALLIPFFSAEGNFLLEKIYGRQVIPHEKSNGTLRGIA